jgi:hypothetical protein
MTGMFYGARSFNRPLEWDTQNVKCMNLLFCEAKSFNQPLRWNIESVKEMSYMFFKAENFNQSLDFLNIQKLNLITSSKTGKRFKKCSLETFLKDMFEECPIEEHHYQSFKKKLSSYQYK